jgi:hypothetical protein
VKTGKMTRMKLKHIHLLMNMSLYKIAALSCGRRAVKAKEVPMTSRIP